MGWYTRRVFPCLCDWALDRPPVANERARLLADADGEVLEIGFGTGLNLPFYPSHVRRITAVDVNPGTSRRARRRIERSGIQVDSRTLSGERLPFDSSFDCVVSTFTLCSIEHVERAIGEIHRVLKPGGHFLFLEHGLSPEPQVQVWQRRLNWVERRLADNCRLDRPIRQLVSAQPFTSVVVSEFYLDHTPLTHGYLYRGVATK